MRRLLATIRCDLVLQIRNGFYAATLFVTALWALVLLRIGALDLRWLLPPMLVGNLLIGTFFFLGALVLLERGEGSLTAQVVSPLRAREYLCAKVATLSGLALAETLVLAPIMAGWRFNGALLVVGVLLAAAIYCLAGFIAVARYDSINSYLLPAGAYVSALWLPLLAYLARWQPWPLALHPLSGPLLLVQAAFVPATPGQVLAGLVSSLAWVGLLAAASRRAFARWMIVH